MCSFCVLNDGVHQRDEVLKNSVSRQTWWSADGRLCAPLRLLVQAHVLLNYEYFVVGEVVLYSLVRCDGEFRAGIVWGREFKGI